MALDWLAMPDTFDELRSEIARLEQENREFKTRARTPGTAGTSIEGLDVFALRIGPDESIVHVNSAFARHLGLAGKEEIIGQPAAVLRRFLNQELITAIVRPAEGQSLVRMAHDDRGRVFEIKTTLHGGMLDVVMQDVTDEEQFRSLVQRYVLKDFDSLSDEDLRTFKFPERRFMTVSFTDLRGFTALTERLSPEEVRSMVNAYFEETIRAVEENEATVAQLVGDEVMAFYGAPRYYKDHALRAIKTACEQIERVEDLCARYAGAGKEMCKCGVGINSGDVILGNMGGAGKQAYTALGAPVNLASRLCGAARGGQVLMSEVVLHAALATLPPGWEMVESRSLTGMEDEDLAGVGGKTEGVQPLPEELRGKVISIGPGIKTQNNPATYTFRYLYLLKPKGARELPVLAVEQARHGRKTQFLSDERAVVPQTEVVIGKYHVLEMIGEGGMGKVWKARDQFENMVAIKMLTAGQQASANQLQRFRREAAIMAKLTHHHICRIHEIGEAEGATYIAMEYVDGVSLGEVLRHSADPATPPGSRSPKSGQSDLNELVESIKQEKKSRSGSQVAGHSGSLPTPAGSVSSVVSLPMQRVLALVVAICEAVQFAHEHGVLHRDLKPENIMIRPDGSPVVMDFGLAKVEEEPHDVSISIEGQIVGTIEYMAPEQAQSSKHVTERADVYSLGALLYQLLTGRKHFESSGSLLRDAQKLQDYESPPLRQYNREIDKDLETIVRKALRPDPVQRYSSVRHLLEDIKRYQAGEPITARARSVSDWMVKRIRKNRAACIFSAALVLLAVLFGSYAYVGWRKQWGGWTKEFQVDFSHAPPAGPAQSEWLGKRFVFQDREAKSAVDPWLVRDGAMKMKPHEWCWLRAVQIPDDAKVFVKLRFNGKPEAFQICLNSGKELRQWDNNPPGYSCRFGIWAGAMDLIARNELDRRNDFNSLVVSSLPPVVSQPSNRRAGKRDLSLAFQRQGEKVSLQVNGKDTHHETYLLPLLGGPGAAGSGAGRHESIGLRTWADDVEIVSIYAYRFKLPESASPTVAGDALVESGQLNEAIDKYQTLARDYETVSPGIAALALTKGYLLATATGNDSRRAHFLTELRKPAPGHWSSLWHRDPRTEYLQKVGEVEALMLWKEGNYREALKAFQPIFQANPDTRIVLECLHAERKPLEPEVSAELLRRTAQTTKLAGLDIGSLGLTSLDPLAGLNSLRGLDCRENRLTSLEPVRQMTQLRALYCAKNRISSLAPIAGLPLAEFFCNDNQIESLEPLKGLALETLYCGENQIGDLSPLQGQPIYSLGCSGNRITSLEPIATLPNLSQLYCAANRLTSLEPLRRAKQIEYLDCSRNAIGSLEPLGELKLQGLDCSGNPLVSLEPFVTAGDPPPWFVFDCETLPEAEIQRAIAAWSSRNFAVQAGSGRLLLALRHGGFDQLKALGTEHAGHRYLYVQKPLNAGAAEQFCTQAGGHLVTIANEEENTWLTQIVPPGGACRIGLVVTGGQPQWVNAEPVAFRPERTDIRASDRIVIWQGGAWLPLPADEDRPMPFVIEWD